MDVLLNFFKILAPLILISFISLFIINILKITDFIEKILLVYILNWFQVVLVIEILSLFNKASLWPLIIFHSAVALIFILISIKNKISHRININKLKKIFADFYNKLELSKILKIILIVWLIVIIATTFFIGVIVPPKNYDSMTYHLARVGFWKQNQSINHYFTRNIRQTEYPVNGEIGLLWIIVFTSSDYIVFIVQWISLIIIILSIVVCIPVFFYSSYFIDLYISEGLNNVLLPVFGVFLGCLITSYTVLVALRERIPDRIKDTHAYRKINKYFLLSLYTLIIKIMLDMSFYFINNTFSIVIQIFLSVFSIFMVAYIIFIMHKLISITT